MNKVPRNVQLLDGSVLDAQHALVLPDALNALLGGVVINHVQNNPLQPDLQYRGFTASPLLGSPQGIAFYQNGVRINEPFGDVMQWDLIPEFAIGEVQLLPGATPLYGWNALGGSLLLRMKDGFRDQGHRVEALAGSFARYQAFAEYGGSFADDWAVYAGVSAFGEEGFRDASPSSARNLYADVRRRTERGEAGLSVTLADTELTGNGPAPVELLAEERDAVFTYPDITRNELLMVAANAEQRLSERISMQGTAYARNLQRGTVNGDEGEFELCPDPDGGDDLLCDEEGELLTSETRLPVVTDEPFNGLYNTTRTATLGYGATLQLGVDEPLFGRSNQFVVGATYDGSHVAFVQRAELGRLTGQRTVQGAGIFIDGDEFRTDLEADERNLGVYASDTLDVLDPLAITVAARFNLANVEIDDRIGDELEGNHTYTRVNPSFGLTYTPLPELTLFASYNEATRAPSAAELSCADPEEPCRVPNAFVADPPLDQVVSRSVELGLRGTLGGSPQRPAFGWSIAGFGSRNADDIIFVAASRVGTGYFRNAGDTQRIGLELAARGELGPVQFYASYTLLRATFESELELPGAAHPDAIVPESEEDEEEAEEDEEDEGGVIQVQKGDRIPGLPTHVGKAGVTVTPVERLELTLQGLAQSSQFLRGDEANLLDPLDGYVILGARVTYRVLDELAVFVKAENLLDTEYETFGVVADPSEVLEGTSIPRFVSPGAPLAFWAGLTLSGF